MLSFILDYGHQTTYQVPSRPKDPGHQQGKKLKPTEPRKVRYGGSIKHGGILADKLSSRHPTVNQSFIEKIVEEIEAKHRTLVKDKSGKANSLQQLIDNVADSVVKQVTKDFTLPRQKPSRRVNVPKPWSQTDISDPVDIKTDMPRLNDFQSREPHAKSAALVEDANKEDLPPEVISSDEVSGQISPDSPPEEVKPSSRMSSTQRSHFVSQRPRPEEPGKQELREMSKFRHRLAKQRPMLQSGKKKVTIPATNEGKTLNLQISFDMNQFY